MLYVSTLNNCFPLAARSENDSDPDKGDSLTFCDGGVVDSSGALIPVGGGPRQMPEGGTLSINSDGCYTFSTSNGDFESLGVGETAGVCFTYLVCDVVGASASAEVCIEITGENDPPVAEDDSYRVTADNPSVSSNIIAPNDSDPETDKLTIVGFDKGDGTGPISNPSSTFSVSFPSGGEMTVNPETGGMTYSASEYADELRDGETFVETATYTISDGKGGRDEATVSIVVVGDQDPPQFINPPPDLGTTNGPSDRPSFVPSSRPSTDPSSDTTSPPNRGPTPAPSSVPSSEPSSMPSLSPSSDPSSEPSSSPSSMPSKVPTGQPTDVPSLEPSSSPSSTPSSEPSSDPSSDPSSEPSSEPSSSPSSMPSLSPSSDPSSEPSSSPSSMPSKVPTGQPTDVPSLEPSSSPTCSETCPSFEGSSCTFFFVNETSGENTRVQCPAAGRIYSNEILVGEFVELDFIYSYRITLFLWLRYFLRNDLLILQLPIFLWLKVPLLSLLLSQQVLND